MSMLSCLAFHMGTRDLNSGPHSCAASALTPSSYHSALKRTVFSSPTKLAGGPTTGQVQILPLSTPVFQRKGDECVSIVTAQS